MIFFPQMKGTQLTLNECPCHTNKYSSALKSLNSLSLYGSILIILLTTKWKRQEH